MNEMIYPTSYRPSRFRRPVRLFAPLALFRGCAFFLILNSAFLLSSGCAVIHPSQRPSDVVELFRPDGSLEFRETIRDTSGGFAASFLEHDSLTNLAGVHTNGALRTYTQIGLGGASTDVSSNAAGLVGATGTAVGNVMGAAAKAAVK